MLQAPPDPSISASSALSTQLQSYGLRFADATPGLAGRRGGAGPTDHVAVDVEGAVVMVPVHTHAAAESPFVATPPGGDGESDVSRDGAFVARVRFVGRPRFYALQTFDGVPYWQIATLHGRDVLATTVLQTCVRYGARETACQFCAIEQSLAAGRTIARKTPQQLAEVARAAQLLDGVRHVVLTTGTPPTPDRGAGVLCESAAAISAATGLAIQAQCEPPDDRAWFARLRDAGVDTLGMHLEAVEPAVRARVMPGKARVPMARYWTAFEEAVAVFGRGQVSTYLIAGLGDTVASILAACERLVALGVYPFVVPLVPVAGTPLERAAAPSAATMTEILRPLAAMLAGARLRSVDVKAGCARCGACSTLASLGG